MSTGLLDVNVLVALHDAAHPNHEDAHRWFGRNRTDGWATCPITINGFVRILSSPAYPAKPLTPADLLARLRSMCAAADHHFWTDSVSLLDAALFQPERIGGHQMITDAYLLGLAVKHGGRLVTFDRGIPLKAVAGATPANLVVLGRREP